MIKLDKLKIVSNIENIEIIDEKEFEQVTKDGVVVLKKYHTDSPFLLDIKVDYTKKELVIEFTGRILGHEYPKLISLETIYRCFERINEMGICSIDVEGMMDADVVKCDVTKDIKIEDVPQLTNYIRNHNKNYNKIVCRRMRNGNLTIDKNVTSKKIKKRMVIYDKEKEMEMASNRDFVKENGLDGAFDGKCRFELNLNSKEQIRTSLGISNNKLKSVLMSDASPILDFIDEVVDTSEPIVLTDTKAYYTMLVLQDCNYDLERVEAKMRALHPSRGSNIKNIMKPYRMMMEQIGNSEGYNEWEKIRKQLA